MSGKEFICTVCPVGCRVTVALEGEALSATGNRCPRGKKYAINECTHPMRVLTTTVKLLGAEIRRLPVISSAELPKERMKDCLELLYTVEKAAPVTCGDVIVQDVCGTGVDIVAARTIGRR